MRLSKTIAPITACLLLAQSAFADIVFDFELDPNDLLEFDYSGTDPDLIGSVFGVNLFGTSIAIEAAETYQFNISFIDNLALRVVNSPSSASEEDLGLAFPGQDLTEAPGGVTGTATVLGVDGDFQGPHTWDTSPFFFLDTQSLVIGAEQNLTDTAFSFTGAQFNFTTADDFASYTSQFPSFLLFAGGFEVVTVPEPQTFVLFGLGLAGMLMARRRRRSTANA